MEKDLRTLMDGVAFQTSDMITPATVLEGAGRYLLSRLPELDESRYDVTVAVSHIAEARKALESASETLLSMVKEDEAPTFSITQADLVQPPADLVGRIQAAQLAAHTGRRI